MTKPLQINLPGLFASGQSPPLGVSTACGGFLGLVLSPEPGTEPVEKDEYEETDTNNGIDHPRHDADGDDQANPDGTHAQREVEHEGKQPYLDPRNVRLNTFFLAEH